MTLKDRSLEIKNATTEGENTASRVGGLLEDYLNNIYLQGWYDYQHSGSNQVYNTPNVGLKMLNNGTGANTRNDFKVEGIDNIFNVASSNFDFSGLEIGDQVDLRIDVSAVTSANNQLLGTYIEFGVGSGSEFTLPIITALQVKQNGTIARGVRVIKFYIGYDFVRDFPARMMFISDANATLTVNGWYVNVSKKSQITP